MENKKPTMLSIKEAAAEYGLSEWFIRRLALVGTIRAIRIGRSKILINAESLAEWLTTSTLTAAN